MLDMTFSRNVIKLLDGYHSDHLALEAQVLSSPAVGMTRVRQAEQLRLLLQSQFDEIDRLIGDDARLYRDAFDLLHGHPLYRDVFLQSAIIAQQSVEPADVPFGFQFRSLIIDRPDIGYSPYAQMLNAALRDLPFCKSVRRLSKSVAQMIGTLPRGSSVLGLDYGPIADTLSLPDKVLEALKLTFYETEPTAITKMTQVSSRRGITVIKSDQRQEVPNEGQWQLILAPYMLAEISTDYGHRNAAADLVQKIFQRLSPGGRLLMASPLITGGENPYRHAHRMLLDKDTPEGAIHRSPAELIALTSLLDNASFRAKILTDDLTSAISGDSVLAVLEIEASQ